MPQFPNVQQSYLSLSADLTSFSTTIQDLKSTFLISGVSRKDVDEAMTMLKSLYQAQCSIHTFKEKELAGMTPEDMEDVKHLMVTQGLFMKKNESDSLTVNGLKDGIKQVTQMITASLQGSLKNELRLREEEDLYSRVAWCILGQSGNWERLPKRANYNLENNETSERIVDAQGIMWSVDLHRMEATLQATAQTTMLKRLVNLPGKKMTQQRCLWLRLHCRQKWRKADFFPHILPLSDYRISSEFPSLKYDRRHNSALGEEEPSKIHIPL